ncbi:MAG: hypothetical protein QMB24_01915 [Spirosomataceae bacterium]
MDEAPSERHQTPNYIALMELEFRFFCHNLLIFYLYEVYKFKPLQDKLQGKGGPRWIEMGFQQKVFES